MITAEDTYDVAGRILEIPVTAIRRAKDNVRTDLGDLTELAASITEVGVLQAITVIADATGETFEVLMGNRRHAASELAGVMTIPAVIRTKPEDAKRVITMLVENVHRADLSALDEARTFARLEELGVDQADIATRVGCSQSHVSKRLSLLDLPAKARKMLTDGELNIGDAVTLARLAEHPTAMKSALDTIAHGGDAERAVKHELDAMAGEQALDEAKADCKAKKIKVLHIARSGGMTYTDSEKKRRAVEGLAQVVKPGEYCYGKHIAFAKPSAHAKEPCHAVTLTLGYNGKVERAGYCTDTKRHAPKGESELKAAKPDKAAANGKSDEQRAREAGAKEATRARREFVTDLLQRRKLDRPDVIARALAKYSLSGYLPDHDTRAKLLGLDLTGRNATVALTDYIAGGTDEVTRACLAVIVAGSVTANTHGYYAVRDALPDFGYELTEWERATAAESAIDEASGEAYDAADRALERAQELEDGGPAILERISELTVELDEGVSQSRAVEISAEFDRMFVELNNIQPGDVVEEASDGGHTIEREIAEAAEAGGGIVEIPEAATHLVDVADDAVLCAFPGCTLNDEHEGDHEPAAPAGELPPYAKAPKDVGPSEGWCRTFIETALAQHPDDAEVHELAVELRIGVEEPRAREIFDRLQELNVSAPLTDYAGAATTDAEKAARKVIATLPADDDRVVKLQQELYAGVSGTRAGPIRRALKKIAEELEAAAS